MTALTERSERAIVMWSIVGVSNDESESARYRVHVQLCAIKFCFKMCEKSCFGVRLRSLFS